MKKIEFFFMGGARDSTFKREQGHAEKNQLQNLFFYSIKLFSHLDLSNVFLTNGPINLTT